MDAEKLDAWPELKAWFFKLKPKDEQHGGLLSTQIKEAGSGICGVQKVGVMDQFIQRRRRGSFSLCPKVLVRPTHLPEGHRSHPQEKHATSDCPYIDGAEEYRALDSFLRNTLLLGYLFPDSIFRQKVKKKKSRPSGAQLFSGGRGLWKLIERILLRSPVWTARRRSAKSNLPIHGAGSGAVAYCANQTFNLLSARTF